jgi:hypothetical protein
MGKAILTRRPVTTLGLLIAVIAVFTSAPGREGSAAQAIDPQQVVDQFYPQALIDRADPPGTPGGIPLIRKSAFVVLEQLPGVPRTILACYSNGADGAIRVIRRSNEVYGVVYEPTLLDLGGRDCRVKIYDPLVLGSPVLGVSFQGISTYSADWFFRWDGTSLVILGPTTNEPGGTKTTPFNNASLLDLSHTGSWVIINPVCARPPVGDENCIAADVYRLSEQNMYVMDRTLLSLEPFGQSSSQPQTREVIFDLPSGTQGPYRMTVVNGERGGGYRTASGTIVLNGQTVVNSGQLNLQAEFVTVNVDLQAKENNMQVTLANRQGAQVWVYVEKVAAP